MIDTNSQDDLISQLTNLSPEELEAPKEGDAHQQVDLFQSELESCADAIVEELLAKYMPVIELELKKRLKPKARSLAIVRKRKN